jgi:NADPH:quinone reductase-like Zn-dependent oxidoreductase
MKAMVFRQAGGPERLELAEVPVPEIAPDEVLVRVAYCGVNPLDVSGLSGRYTAVPMPHILGSEIAGTVEKLGGLTGGVHVGERVVVAWRLFDGTCSYCLQGHESICVNGGILGVKTQGGYAEFVAVPVTNVLPLPENVSLADGAAVTLSTLTAWHMVLTRGGLRAGEVVLVMGASGGVGVAAVQVAHLAGAYVLAVTGDAHKAAALRDLGADDVIDRQAADVREAVMQLTGGLGADLVVDTTGAAGWAASFGCVARNGRWTTCGVLTGAEVTLNLSQVYGREVQIIGATGASRKELFDLLAAVARGNVKPVVWRTFPLEAAADAIRSLSARERLGKILLEVQPA